MTKPEKCIGAIKKIGTTGKGIGPAYEDSAARTGIRFAELSRLPILIEKLKEIVSQKNKYLKYVLNSDLEVDLDSIIQSITVFAKELLPFQGYVSTIVNNALIKQEKVVFEGGQGALLDKKFGCAPYVTSSSTISGSVSTGVGIGPQHVGYVLGVVKAYTTRVGSGPFPTELTSEVGDALRINGCEYGTVTKRPRRCGWFDAVSVKYAVQLSGIQSIALTKLDVLAGFEKIKICHRYLKDGKKVDHFPTLIEEFEELTPDYIELDGWDDSIKNARKWHELPASARLYIQTISEIIDCPVSIISLGAERSSTIFLSQAEYLKNFI